MLCQLFYQLRIFYGKNLNCEQCSILSTVDSHRCNRYTGRHLYKAQQCIHTGQRCCINRNTDDRNGSKGSDETTQMSSCAGCGNNYLYATVTGTLSKVLYYVRSTVSGSNYYFSFNAKLLQSFFCSLKYRPVRITTHDNCNFH